MIWQTTRFRLDLFRPRIMGIVNVTPDSFSDGGQHPDQDSALRHCEQLLRDGADLLDIGGESTRPGAAAVPADVELSRVLPVVRHALTLGVPISVDTRRAAVMRTVLDLGVDVINDVNALQDPACRDLVSAHPGCGICLMHMHRDPRTMQQMPMQGDAVPEVRRFLAEAAASLQALGVARERIVLDPGIGFGKTVAQNFSLLARQHELTELGYPLLVGWSRKSSLGAVAARGSVVPSVADRLPASLAAALLSVERGAAIVRVHDVRETAQALAVWQAMHDGGQPGSCAGAG
ncbi:MAG: dihydropteroate synthase [Burkholderiaceae bacterium]|nr:dihydropteroate synthase [Burkholderiaceae bacterium]